jgi:hypothetical protein
VAASTPVATHAAFIQRQTNRISTPSIIVFFIAPDFQAFSGFEFGSAAAGPHIIGDGPTQAASAINADRMVGEWRV